MLKAAFRGLCSLLSIASLAYGGWLWWANANVLYLIGGIVGVLILLIICCAFEGLVLDREV